MKEIHWLQFETPSFTFDAFGRTRDSAMCAMIRRWNAHQEQTGADPMLLSKYADDIRHRVIPNLPACFRDGDA